MKSSTSLSAKLEELRACRFKPFVNTAIRRRLSAIKHLPGTGDSINRIWRDCVVALMMITKFPKLKKKTLFTLASLPKTNWMTFLDKLRTSSSDEHQKSMLPLLLLKILLQELISKEKDYRPFWTPVYKELSEKLSSPTEIGFPGSVSSSSKLLLTKQEEKSQFLTMNRINLHRVQNKNSQKTFCLSSTSIAVAKWEEEATKPSSSSKAAAPLLKSLKIKMKPSRLQRSIIDEWINTSRYVYNKTVACIYDGDSINHFQLRDKLVTENTKKNNKEYIQYAKELQVLQSEKKLLDKDLKKCKNRDDSDDNKLAELVKQIDLKKKSRSEMTRCLVSEKTEGMQSWELNTPKSVRDGAVADVCKAYKTGFSNLKLGNIKHFRMNFKKKSNPDKCVCIPKSLVKNKSGVIHLAPTFFKGEHCKFNMGKKTLKKYKELEITNDTRIVKQKDVYWLLVPIPQETSYMKPPAPYRFCGIDPGVRTFMTAFGNENECNEYNIEISVIDKLNAKLDFFCGDKKRNQGDRRRVRCKRILKRKVNKVETRKTNLINELHYKVINDLLKRNDVIFYGDIKSHDIVKNGKNRTLNKNVNDLKFYKFKERLLFKASERKRKIVLVNEAYTTQTCSFCGGMYKPGISKVYDCKNCNKRVDRDINASKNILMKGILKPGYN